MPFAGAAQVTWVGVFCVQVEGGSMPLAALLWFARVSAFVSALGGGVCDVVPEVLRPIQVPSPARSTTAAASAAIQRGCRYQRGPRGSPWAGGTPAGWPGSPGPATPYSRRWEARVPPDWPASARPAAGWP